jgi:hypothetical protein
MFMFVYGFCRACIKWKDIVEVEDYSRMLRRIDDTLFFGGCSTFTTILSIAYIPSLVEEGDLLTSGKIIRKST